jgi:hypothetical protein
MYARVQFVDRERIELGPENDRGAGRAAGEDRRHAGTAEVL